MELQAEREPTMRPKDNATLQDARPKKSSASAPQQRAKAESSNGKDPPVTFTRDRAVASACQLLRRKQQTQRREFSPASRVDRIPLRNPLVMNPHEASAPVLDTPDGPSTGHDMTW